ncbi:MAG: beta-lactamase family protein, partial [Deltaproteobacteria bacterium]|nr:beta-lactamase family protein [Deltaproteobacteria bacterium]
MKYFTVGALGLSLVFGCTAPAQSVHHAAGPPPALARPLPRDYEQLRERLREIIPMRMEEHAASSISIAIVDGQQLVWAESFGVAQRQGAVPATPTTSYEIGSLSKPFVGLAVMQLVEAGELELDAPLTDVLTEFQIGSRFPGPRVPTLRQLLSHRAGLPTDLPALDDRDDYAIAQLPAALEEQWLVQPPGRMAIYSNVGIDLAALTVQRKTGKEFSVHLEEAVLEPMSMPHASARGDNVGTTERATGYDGAGDPAKPIGYTPCGSIRASVTELAQLVRWVNGHGQVGGSRLLSAEGVAEMTRPQNVDNPLDLGAAVGLTWFIRRGSKAVGDIVWHMGSTAGFMSQVSIAPKHGVGVVVLGNDSSFLVPGIADDALALALHAKTGLDLPAQMQRVAPYPPAPAMPLVAARLDQLAAPEYSDGTTLFRFEHRRGELTAHLHGRRTLALIPRPDGTFDTETRVLGIPTGEPFVVQRISFETIDGEQLMVARGATAAWVF